MDNTKSPDAGASHGTSSALVNSSETVLGLRDAPPVASDPIENEVLNALSRLAEEVGSLRAEVKALKESEQQTVEDAGADPSKPTVEPLWTRQDVADYLRCSLRFVDSLIADNALVGMQIGGLKRFDRRTVEAMAKGSADRRLSRCRTRAKAA